MSVTRWLRLLLVVVLAGGVITACAPADEPASDTGENGAEQVEGEMGSEEDMADEGADAEEDMSGEDDSGDDAGDEGMADDSMGGELGMIELGPDDPFEIGAMFVLSGPNESLGVDSRDGVELAVAEIGNIMGHAIELTVEDSACSPEGGQTAATRLAAEETLAGVIGTSCSSAAEPAIPIICEAGMLMISPSNTAPSFTADDRPESFGCYLRTAHNDLFQGRVAAEFAYNELGLRTAATVHDGSPYAQELQRVFAERFEELGGEVPERQAVNAGDTDMAPVLTAIAATEPEVIYYPIFTAEGGYLTAQARETPGLEDTVLMGADGLYSPDFVDAAGAAAEGVYLSGPYVGSGPQYEDFLATLEEEYGRGPLSGFHAHAYDATRILLQAAQQVAEETDDGGLRIDRQALIDAAFSTTGYEGLTGTLTCSETGDCATGEALAVFQIGAEEVADPEAAWPPEVVYQP